MKRQLTTTSDGSHTFYIEDMDEQYHSMHGSIAEAEHIFIQAGLIKVAEQKNSFKIFEVGMGTALNVYLTAIAAAKEQLDVEMHSIEAFPLKVEEAALLNYPKLLNYSEAFFLQIHKSDWNKAVNLSEGFRLKKIKDNMETYQFVDEYDLVYFDAFAPEKQSEMWRPQIFREIFKAMKPNGVLVTYCVKGVVRRMLQELGFEIEKLAGPEGGKREMLRAVKP